MTAHPMDGDEREEIAAAVAASGELGSRYDSAIAEGLVERIGQEIDKRVEARLRGQQAPITLPHAPPAPAPAQPAQTAPRRGAGVTGLILGLGSMGIGIGATAVVTSNAHNGFAQAVMVLLIWAAIALVNLAHARRR